MFYFCVAGGCRMVLAWWLCVNFVKIFAALNEQDKHFTHTQTLTLFIVREIVPGTPVSLPPPPTPPGGVAVGHLKTLHSFINEIHCLRLQNNLTLALIVAQESQWKVSRCLSRFPFCPLMRFALHKAIDTYIPAFIYRSLDKGVRLLFAFVFGIEFRIVFLRKVHIGQKEASMRNS